jgi:hypothetical protein
MNWSLHPVCQTQIQVQLVSYCKILCCLCRQAQISWPPRQLLHRYLPMHSLRQSFRSQLQPTVPIPRRRQRFFQYCPPIPPPIMRRTQRKVLHALQRNIYPFTSMLRCCFPMGVVPFSSPSVPPLFLQCHQNLPKRLQRRQQG